MIATLDVKAWCRCRLVIDIVYRSNGKRDRPTELGPRAHGIVFFHTKITPRPLVAVGTC